jgi:ABC-type transport system involved in multi-copper enzyme maturation permease subunit
MYLTALPIAAIDGWLTKWLTPIWLLGVGAGVGLVLLACFLLLFWLLARTGVFRTLQASSSGHFVSLALSLVLAGIGTVGVRQWFASSGEPVANDELILLSVMIWAISAVFSWALIYCPSHRMFDDLRSLLFEGYGAVLLSAVGLFALAGIASSFVASDTGKAFESLPQVFSPNRVSMTLPAIEGLVSDTETPKFFKQDIRFDPLQLKSITVESDRNITIADSDDFGKFQTPPFDIPANEPVVWNVGDSEQSPLPVYAGSEIFIQNAEIDPANVQVTIESKPPVPEVSGMIVSALSVLIVGLLFLLQQAVAPRVSAISMAAAKSEMVQPIFLFLLAIGAFAILLFTYMSFFTLGEDIKLVKDCGITIILILALIQGIWTASNSVSEEIEGRTALTVLSKPINRRSFMIGKMLGTFWIILLMFVVLGACLVIAVAYKPIYDARETSETDLIWQICFVEASSIIPGLVMAFLHAVVLSTLSVAISTRVSQFANFAICLSIYIVGQLVETIISSSEDGFAILQFFGQLIAVIVPNLESFSMQSAIDIGKPIPMSYLSGSFIYAVGYAGVAVLIGLLLFEDRDLA